MSLTVGELQVLLSGDTRPFNRDIDKLDSRAGKTEGIWSGAFKKIAITGGAAIATLGVASFLNDTKKIGVEYTNQLNTLQAVSGATAAQIADVGKTAKVLGSDLTLPATSAADAAAVMTELAKASFSVSDAQDAAKGSLQLAAAAQIEGAQAATIQANAINAFGLEASDAGRVADVLANSANASSAEITDMADAMAQAGGVAASAHISIEDTAAALGIFANNGVKGSDAGTLLKSTLLALRDTSKPAQAAMEDLGLTVYDAQGNFVGLESIFGDLSEAQKTMSQEAFESATNILFGSDASRAAAFAASAGAEGFDTMRDAMSKSGAAADVAAAKSKGLGGAIEGFKSQVETFQIDLFERASPNIEKLVRYAAAEFPKVGDAIFDGIDRGVEVIGDLKDTAQDAFQAVAGYIEPVTSQLDDLYESLTATNGPLDAVWGGLKLTGGALLEVADALSPVVELGGAFLGFFSSLPGPIQTAVIGLAALKAATSFDFMGKLAGKNGIAGGFGTAGQSVVGFAQTVKANMSLADESVGMVSRTAGGLAAGFETYMPRASAVVGNFRGEISSAFQQAKMLQQYNVGQAFGTDAISKSTGDLAGFTAAAKTAAKEGIGGLRSAGAGLVSFLGGPLGVGLAGATVVFAAATASMEANRQKVDEWSQAILRGGEAAEKAAAQAKEASDGWFNAATDFGQFGGHKGPDSVFEQMFGGDDDELWQAAKKNAKDLYDAMSPLEQKQQDVTEASNNLQDAIARWGPNSGQAIGAAVGLRDAQAALKGAEDEVTDAVKTQIDKLNERANLQLAQVSSALAAQQSQFTLADQIKTTNGVIAEQGLGSDAATRSLTDLAQQAINNAQAQGKAAADQAAATGITDTATFSNLAMLRALEATAQQMGVNTPASITTLIASLSASGGAAALTSQAMSDLGIKVTEIPGEKFVRIEAPTAEQQQKIEELGGVVRTLPDGHVYVFANTADADAAVTNFVSKRRTIDIQVRATMPDLNGAVSGSGRPGAATGGQIVPGGVRRDGGGPVFGPGGPTADLVPAVGPGGLPYRLSNGEWIVKSSSVNKYGPAFMRALNAGSLAFQTPGATAAGSSSTSTGSGSVSRNYSWQGVVREEMSLDRFVALQRQAEAIYG